MRCRCQMPDEAAAGGQAGPPPPGVLVLEAKSGVGWWTWWAGSGKGQGSTAVKKRLQNAGSTPRSYSTNGAPTREADASVRELRRATRATRAAIRLRSKSNTRHNMASFVIYLSTGAPAIGEIPSTLDICVAFLQTAARPLHQAKWRERSGWLSG